MAINTTCKYCGAQMDEVRREEVAGSVYVYLKCSKCKKEIARRDD